MMQGNHALKSGLLIIIVLILAILAYARNTAWRTTLTLWADVVAKSPYKVQGHYYLGEAYHGQKKYDEALALYQRAIMLDSAESLNAYGNIGNLYLDKGEFERAAELFTRLLAIDANDYQSNIGRGKAYREMGRYSDALADFNRAIALAPAVSRYYLYRAETYLKLNEQVHAREDMVRSCDMMWEESCKRLTEMDSR